MVRHLRYAGLLLGVTSLPIHALPAQDSASPSHSGTNSAASGASSARTISNLTWYAPRSVGHESLENVQILTKLTAEQSKIMDDKHVIGKMMAATYRTWIPLIPDEARSPTLKKGNVAIELTLHPDGRVTSMRLAKVSGDVALDRAAWYAVTDAAKYPPFPAGLDLPELRLRLSFVYNGDEAKAAPSP